MLKSFSIYYVLRKLRKEPFKKVIDVMLLVPILVVISIFSTTLMINYINSTSYITSSKFNSIITSDVKKNYPNEFRVEPGLVGTKKGIIGISLFLMEEDKSYDLSQTYFNSKNLITKGSTKYTDDNLISIDFTTAAYIGAKSGDIISVNFAPRE